MSALRLPMCHGKLPRSREFIERGADTGLAAMVENFAQGAFAPALARPGAGLALILAEQDQALLLAMIASQDALGRAYPWALAERWPWPRNGHQGLRLAYRLAGLAGALPASAAAGDTQALDAQRQRLAIRDEELEQDRAWHALAGHGVANAAALWGQWHELRGWPEQGCRLLLHHPAEVLAAMAAACASSHGAPHLAWTGEHDGGQGVALAGHPQALAAALAAPLSPPVPSLPGLRSGDMQQHLQRFLAQGRAAGRDFRRSGISA